MSPLCQGQFEDLHCQSQILEKMNYPGTTKGEDYHELETARKAQLKFAAILIRRPNAFCRKSSWRLAICSYMGRQSATTLDLPGQYWMVNLKD